MKILKFAVLTATLGVFSLPALAIPISGDSINIILTSTVDNCDNLFPVNYNGDIEADPNLRDPALGSCEYPAESCP